MADRGTRLWGFRHVATRYLNRFTRPFAAWLPGFGVISHRGRKSGRIYRTPVNVFRRGDTFLFFMTYGPDVQWVKNVQAAGLASIHTRGRDVALTDPELFEDPQRRSVPPFVRGVGRLLGATWFLRMRRAST